MTDKKMIDVTKCIHFNKSDIPNGCTCYWDGECNHDCYYKQLVCKEQECKRLKFNNDYEVGALERTIDNLKTENIKLKHALAEIKYIAEENIRIADLEGLSGVYRRGLAEQILQKISEVEDDRQD